MAHTFIASLAVASDVVQIVAGVATGASVVIARPAALDVLAGDALVLELVKSVPLRTVQTNAIGGALIAKPKGITLFADALGVREKARITVKAVSKVRGAIHTITIVAVYAYFIIQAVVPGTAPVLNEHAA